MKQEILCPKCAEEVRRRYTPYPGEYTKLTAGIALNEYVCDSCGQGINPETLCAAFSIWTDKIPFIPGWEERYIDPILDKDVTDAAHAAKRMGATP